MDTFSDTAKEIARRGEILDVSDSKQFVPEMDLLYPENLIDET